MYWLPNGKELKGKNRPTKETIETFALGFQKMIFGGLHRRGDHQLYGQAVAGRPDHSPGALSSSVHIALRFKHHTIEKRKAGPGDPVSMMSTGGYTSECWTYLYCTEPDGGWEKPLSEHTPDDPNCVLSDQWHGDCDGDVNWIPPGGSGGGSDGGVGGGGPPGGGSGGSSGGSGGGGNGEVTPASNFLGEIDASDLANHPKANCIYQKLSQTGSMRSLIAEFAGEDTDFDLDIVVGTVDGGYGTLNSTEGDHTFHMKIDQEGLLQRKSIQTAVTFIHEAIHAEMRRYLYGANDASSLPGFPGDFAVDWDLYVNTVYGGNPTLLEHEAMAARYRNIIVSALKQYDNDAITDAKYEALAWHGLSDTMIYTSLSAEQRQAISDTYLEAVNQSTDTCN